jgi:hypothetical protein
MLETLTKYPLRAFCDFAQRALPGPILKSFTARATILK